jgi:NADH-quinone oxidoreductase subunit J
MTVGFWILGVLLIASAVWTVTARKPVYSVVALLAHFLALAFMYITLSAEFLAVVQMIVYSGAILILFVFVITLLSSGVAPFSAGPNRMRGAEVPAAVVAVAALGFTAYGVARFVAPPANAAARAASGVVGTANAFGSVSDFGKVLFTTHLLPFEITAFILMVAVIGVILLAGDKTPYAPSPQRAAVVRRDMREAILRAGDD